MSLCELLDGCVLCKAKLACVELKPILVTVLLLLHPFNGLSSRTAWVSWYQKGKSSLHLLRSEMMGFWDGSGISWTICKQSADNLTNTSSLRLVFTGQMLLLPPNRVKAPKARFFVTVLQQIQISFAWHIFCLFCWQNFCSILTFSILWMHCLWWLLIITFCWCVVTFHDILMSFM